MIKNALVASASLRHLTPHTLAQARDLLRRGTRAVRQQWAEIDYTAKYCRKLNAAAWIVHLCEDRIKSTFDMPRSMFNKELRRAGCPPHSGPLSVTEIITLHRNPAIARLFNEETQQAILAYLAAVKKLSELRHRSLG